MADIKLFDRVNETTPTDPALKIAYGSGSDAAKNISLADLKTWISSTSGALNTKVFEIGSWNMDSASEHWVATDIPFADILKIRKVTVMVRSDDYFGGFKFLSDVTAYDGSFDIGPDTETFQPIVAILIKRATGGHYDNNTYDNTSINRGWVTVDYTN